MRRYPADVDLTFVRTNMEKYTALCDVDPGMRKHPLGNIWMPSCYPADGLEAALKFQLRDTDILTATYPKTGTNSIGLSCNFSRHFFQHIALKRTFCNI